MSNAFSPGRLSLWHTSLESFKPNLPAYKDLGVTDVFLDMDKATVADMDFVRKSPQLSGDGKPFRAQLYLARNFGDGAELARYALTRIGTLKPGVIEVDFEPNDDETLRRMVGDFLFAFRQGDPWRLVFPICVNVVPMKGYTLPLETLAASYNTFVRVQRYYGAQMRGAEATLLREDIVGRGFPAERFSFMESAKARRLKPDPQHPDGELVCDLPIFSDNGVKVRNLSGGAIFNANELRNAGLV